MILRLLITAGLLLIPFVLLAIASGKADGFIWLMIPFVAMLPVLFLVSLLLAPAEALAIRHGLSADAVVIALGSIIGAIFCGVALKVNKNRAEVLDRLLSGDLQALGAILGVVAVGALVGFAWRCSARILEHWA